MKNVSFAAGSDYLSKDVQPAKKHVKTRLRARFSFLFTQKTHLTSLCLAATITLADRRGVCGGGSQKGGFELGIGSD